MEHYFLIKHNTETGEWWPDSMTLEALTGDKIQIYDPETDTMISNETYTPELEQEADRLHDQLINALKRIPKI